MSLSTHRSISDIKTIHCAEPLLEIPSFPSQDAVQRGSLRTKWQSRIFAKYPIAPASQGVCSLSETPLA